MHEVHEEDNSLFFLSSFVLFVSFVVRYLLGGLWNTCTISPAWEQGRARCVPGRVAATKIEVEIAEEGMRKYRNTLCELAK